MPSLVDDIREIRLGIVLQRITGIDITAGDTNPQTRRERAAALLPRFGALKATRTQTVAQVVALVYP